MPSGILQSCASKPRTLQGFFRRFVHVLSGPHFGCYASPLDDHTCQSRGGEKRSVTDENTFGTVATAILSWLTSSTQQNGGQLVEDLGAVIATSKGLVRVDNQDRCLIARSKAQGWMCFVLCDGIGGMPNGAAAAEIAACSFIESLYSNRRLETRERVLRASISANLAVHRRFGEKGGTTLAAVIQDTSGDLFGLTVGDSRIYRVFAKLRLEQLSSDDTIAGELQRIKGAEFRPDLADPTTRQLAQYIGMGPGIQPRIYGPLKPLDDWILLSTDGIHSMSSKILERISINSPNPYKMGTRLIQVSEWLGGDDNASLVIFPANLKPRSENINGESAPGIEVWSPFGKMQVLFCSESSAPVRPSPSVKELQPKDRPLETESGATGTVQKTGRPERKPHYKRKQKSRGNQQTPPLGMELIEAGSEPQMTIVSPIETNSHSIEPSRTSLFQAAGGHDEKVPAKSSPSSADNKPPQDHEPEKLNDSVQATR